EVELWKIGDSPVAPKFNVVSQPNDWSRTISSAARAAGQGGLSETRQMQFEYWTAFRRGLEERGGRVKPTKPVPQHWQTFGPGRSYFHLCTFANSRDKRIGIQLILTGSDAKAHFHLLEQQKREIEKEVGEALEWKELPERKESHVNLRWQSCDP